MHKDVKDLSKIASLINHGRFTASGQFCIGVKRVAVHSDIYDQLIDHIVKDSTQYVPGFMRDENAKLTPVGMVSRCDNVVNELLSQGATLCNGGAVRVNYRDEPDKNGMFYRATVIADVPLDSPTVLDEIFMPILPIMKASNNIEETVYNLNKSPYKLKATIHAHDDDVINYFIENVDVGAVTVNGSHFQYRGGYIVGGPGLSSISCSGARNFPFEMSRQKVIHR